MNPPNVQNIYYELCHVNISPENHCDAWGEEMDVDSGACS